MTKEERRALMPECSKFLDDLRECWQGGGITASENGQEIEWGAPSWKSECVSVPADPMALNGK